MDNLTNFMSKKISDITIELDHIKTLYDGVRGFKHDFDNIMTTIGGYIELNDMDGLKKYYTGLHDNCIYLKNLQIINPEIINNPGVYNLISSNYQKATQNNVKLNFEFFFDFTKLHMPIFEFTRILGILLDNAIEAAKDCSNGVVNVSFRDSTKDNIQYVIIENTYIQKDVDVFKIFEKGKSSKASHSGIGLWEVRQIVNKFNNVELFTSKNDTYFRQELLIKNH